MKKLFLFGLSCLLAGSVFAQDADSKGEVVATPPSIASVSLAGQLAKYGYANNSATALIEAAKLYLSVNPGELKPEAVQKGEGAATEKKEGVALDPKRLLADARELSEGDATLLALIAKVETSGTRGAVGGAKRTTDMVKANSTDIYTIRFYAGSTASVLVSGDGDTDLDLYIYDANGNLIESDTDYSDTCLCQWTPKWTGSFTVKIKNRGNVYNRYTLVTN